jgi:hypothetical protein
VEGRAPEGVRPEVRASLGVRVDGRHRSRHVDDGGRPGPAPIWAGACDDKLGETVQATGAYVATRQTYGQAFVFAMRLDCHGQQELVTVQRSTGNLPVCSPDQPVEVMGTLLWNRALVDGHYEINNPSKVVCVPRAQAGSRAEAPRATPPPGPGGADGQAGTAAHGGEGGGLERVGWSVPGQSRCGRDDVDARTWDVHGVGYLDAQNRWRWSRGGHP